MRAPTPGTGTSQFTRSIDFSMGLMRIMESTLADVITHFVEIHVQSAD